MIAKFGPAPEYDMSGGEFPTMKDAFQWMKKQVLELGMEWRYLRGNFDREGNWIEVDFGSWSLFFYLTELTDEDWKYFFKDDTEKQEKPHKPKFGIGIDVFNRRGRR